MPELTDTKIAVQYVGNFDEVEIAATGDEVKRGHIVDVDEAIAGHPPVGQPGDDGYDPGAGLLAQVDNWIPGELDGMTVDALKSYADTLGADLGGATRKPEIVKAIRAHAEQPPEPELVDDTPTTAGDAGADQE